MKPTERKFTDEEITELLNAYVERMCGKCNVKDLGTCCGTCFITAVSQGADLINRQKAEALQLEEQRDMWMEKAEELKIELKAMRTAAHAYKMHYETARAEAFKEFAERLKSDLGRIPQHQFTRSQVEWSINTFVKEMTEENK